MPALRARRSATRGGALSAAALRTGRVVAGLLAAAASFALALPAPAAAQATTSGSDRFVAGAAVTERAEVGGDLLAAGGSVDVYGAVDGDAVVAGGTVRLDSDVAQSVYAAGGRVTLVDRVGHNARLAGAQVQLEPSAHVAGNLTVTGGRIELRGTIDGSVGAAGADVLIDARIGGDVEVAARSLALGPAARIDGNLRYRSNETLQRDPAAQVRGSVERLGAGAGAGAGAAEGGEGRAMRWVGTGLLVLWTIGLTLLAAIAVALLPRATASLSQALHRQPGWALLLGFAVLACTPIAVLMAFVTVIGIPLGLVLLLVYLMLLPVAWIAAAIGVGDWFVARLPSTQPDRVAPRVVAAALAVVLLAFLTQVPWVGGWIAFVVLIAGLGALALQPKRLLAG